MFCERSKTPQVLRIRDGSSRFEPVGCFMTTSGGRQWPGDAVKAEVGPRQLQQGALGGRRGCKALRTSGPPSGTGGWCCRYGPRGQY